MADGIADRGPQLLGINIAFAALAFLTVLLRSYVRIGLVKQFALDDWVMLAALVRPARTPLSSTEKWGHLGDSFFRVGNANWPSRYSSCCTAQRPSVASSTAPAGTMRTSAGRASSKL